MMKRGHQLLSVTLIYGAALFAKNHEASSEHIVAFANLISGIPIFALPFILMCSIMPDIDGGVENSKAGKVSLLAPIAVVVKYCFSHRGFTHNILGIAGFGALLYFVSFFHFNIFTLAIFTYLLLGSILIILDRGPVRMIMSWFVVITAPLLLNPIYYQSVLFACFVAYISHMFGDLVSTEGWTLFSLFGKRFHLSSPFSFRVGGMVEMGIIYPLMVFTIFYIIYSDMDFWKLKLLKEGHDLLMVYKSML